MNIKEKITKSFLESIEGWKSVLDSSPDLIAILDMEFKVVWVNKAMAKTINTSHDSCLGLKCFEAVHGTESPIPNCPHAKMLSDGQEYTEEVNEENLGGCFIVTASPIRDESGNVRGSIHITRDINERKKAEEKIQRFADIIESSDDAIITKSLDGTILSWNKGAERIYGYSAEEVFGKSISILEPSQLRLESIELINKIKRGEWIDHYETLRLRKDGKTISVSVTLSPVFDTSGELVAISAISRDVTERKKVEKQNQKLLEDVQQLNEELEVSNEELQATNEELHVSNEELQDTTEELQVTNEELQNTTEELQAANEELRQQGKDMANLNQALQENKEHYQQFFDNPLNGLALCEIITDDNGEPVDFVYLKVNDVFEEFTGLKRGNVLNKKVSDVLPIEEVAPAVEIYGKVALTGKSEQFEINIPSLNKIYNIVAFSPRKMQFIAMFTDITQQKKTEETILWNQRRNELLAEVSSRLLTSENPQDIVDDLCHKTMEFLECDVFFNYLVDENKGCLHLNAYSGIPEEEAQEIEWLDYGVAVCGCVALESRRIIAENIFETPDPRTDLVKSYGVQAYACHPLLIEGLSIGTLSFGTNSRTKFTDEELELMKAVADQISIAMNRLISNRILKESEEAAIQARNEWEETFEAVPDLIAILDTDYKVVRANKAMADRFGITPEECVGLTCYNVVHGMDAPPSFCPHQQLLEDGSEHTEEVHEDSLGGDFLVSASPLHDSEGKLVGSVHVARDINERKKKEKELYQLNRAYRALSNSSQAMISAKDELEYLESVCNIVVEDCGHSMVWIGYAEEDENKTVLPVAHAGFDEGYIETLNVTWADNEQGNGPTGTAIRTGKPSACKNMLTDPKFKPWREEALKRGYSSSVVLPLIFGGKSLGALSIYSTEPDPFSEDEVILLSELAENLAYGINVIRLRIAREKAEAKLKEAKDNLEIEVEERTAEIRKQADLLDLTHDAILVRDFNDKITFWNKGAEEIYGWSQDEALGKVTHDLLQTEFSKSLAEIKAAVLTHDWWNGELTHIKRDGTKIIVSSRWSLQKDENNKPIGFMEINIDITERKKAEEHFRKELERENLLLGLHEKAPQLTDKELYDYVLDHAVSLTDSTIGFFHMVSDDQKTITLTTWNNETLKNCTASSETHYPIEQAGNWVDCIHLKRPVVYNDFKNSPNRKGLPEGHIPLERFMSIPVMDGDKVVFIFGVGNKVQDYTDQDVIQIQLVANELNKIIKQRRFEEALRLSSIYNRSLIEASLDPLVTIGPNGKITDVNGATEAVTGYSRDELIGNDFSDYFTQPEKAREGYKQVFQEGWVIDYPLEIQHRNGHITPVLYNASVYEDELGNVIGVFAAARDITELKRAESEKQKLLEQAQEIAEELEVSNEELQAATAELQVSNEELQTTTKELQAANEDLEFASKYNRSLIETSLDPLVTIGPDGRITDVNMATELVTGYYRNELIGTDFSNYFTEPEKARKGYQEVFRKGQVFDYPLEIKHKEGHLTPVLYNASVYHDDWGNVIGIFAAARDVTELKKAEEELEFAGKYNRSLIEASLDPLVTIGPDGKITDVNHSTEAVTGYSRDELIGTDFSNYFTEPDKAREGYQQVFKENYVRDYPLEIQHKMGHVTPVLYNASVYRDDSGKVIGVFAAARDITERKKAEKLLKLKLEELARSNAELEQFAYVSSHDLQEPLRMIGSYLQLLQRRYEGQLDDKADKYINFAVDGATRMQNLINDLLEFSRVTTRAREFEPTDCEFVLSQVLSNLEVSIKENEAVISHDHLPTVIADSTQMVQVFQNLISNAIKFRSEKPPKIYISAEKEDDHWIFSVADNGIGIDPKHSDRIFEVFKRLHKRREYPGTGIGLSICKKIVERHGGHIWVESEPNKGSIFYFTLPKEGVINDKASDS